MVLRCCCSLAERSTSCSTLHTIADWLQMPGHRSRKRAFPCRRFRVFARSGVAVVLQCCGRVVGQWSHSMVRSVVWSGPVGGPVAGPVCGVVCGLVDGPVCGPVRAVCCPSKHVLLHTVACQLQMLGYWSRKRAYVLLFPSSCQLGVPYY